MRPDHQQFGFPLAKAMTASLIVWASVVGATYWAIRWLAAEDARLDAPTGADSGGLPLFAVGILLAAVLLLLNVLLALVLRWRKRAAATSASRPAV